MSGGGAVKPDVTGDDAASLPPCCVRVSVGGAVTHDVASDDVTFRCLLVLSSGMTSSTIELLPWSCPRFTQKLILNTKVSSRT